MHKKIITTDIDFLTLPKKQCMEVCKLVFENAKNKFEEAEILAEKGRYNTASSLLIVSNEELLKGLILFLDGNGFNIRKIAGMKSLFNNHKLRYLLALVISMLSFFSKEFSSLMINLMTANSEFLTKIDPDNPDFDSRVKKYLVDMISTIKKEIEFFSKVDKARQQGLYSDYKNGLIKITENEYNDLYSKISVLNNAIHMLVTEFSAESWSVKNQKDEFIKTFNRDYKKHIPKLLKKINSPKFNSYDNMLELVGEMEFEITNNFNINEFITDKKHLSKLIAIIKDGKGKEMPTLNQS